MAGKDVPQSQLAITCPRSQILVLAPRREGKGLACVRARQSHRYPTRQAGLRVSHSWPWTPKFPMAPPPKRGAGVTGLVEGVKGVGLQLPQAGVAEARRKEARPGTGADDPDLRGVRASPSELRGECWAAGGTRSRERCAQPQADARGPPGPRSRPAHRHGRRVQREALVVVVQGPVQRVLQLRPRTPLGLADPLLALVVHPAGSPPAGSATTSAQLASCHQCAAPLPAPQKGCLNKIKQTKVK